MPKEIEIERRFLLKRMPILPYKGVKTISQCYLTEEGEKVRYRGESYNGELRYIRLVKTQLEPGVNEGNYEIIQQEEFVKNYGVSEKKITKKRHLYEDKDSKLTWEVDNFSFNDLIIVEVELPSKDTEFDIPKEIQDVLIMEVTQFDEFSNYSLSDNIESE